MNKIVSTERKSLIVTMASRYGMEADIFQSTVQKTCMPSGASKEEFVAFLMVANEHGLNPVTREIYAFPKKDGGIQPIVGIDGWMTLINSHPQSDGMEFDDLFDDKNNLQGITCRIYRKDRARPTQVTEYMDECKRSTAPWQQWPARMLRHKAAIQCARYAFGFAGIIDPEEAERSPEVETQSVIAPAPPTETPQAETQDPASEEPDHADLFNDLELALSGAPSLEDIEEAWNGFDIESLFDGDDLNRSIADKIKQRRIDEIVDQFPGDLPAKVVESAGNLRAG